MALAAHARAGPAPAADVEERAKLAAGGDMVASDDLNERVWVGDAVGLIAGRLRSRVPAECWVRGRLR